jgi:hypothetical protein
MDAYKSENQIWDTRAALMPYLFANRGVKHPVPIERFMVTGSGEKKQGMPKFRDLMSRFKSLTKDDGNQTTQSDAGRRETPEVSDRGREGTGSEVPRPHQSVSGQGGNVRKSATPEA